MSEALVIIAFLATPFLIPVIGVTLLNWRARRRPAAAVRFYSLNVGGSKVVISRYAFAKIILIAFPVLFLSSILTLIGPFLMLILLSLLVFFGTKRYAPSTTSENTRSVLEALKTTAQQVEFTRTHLEALSADVLARQVEIEESERLHESLRKQIEHKLKEVDAWRTLTEDQKSVFIDAARQALQKTSTIRLATVALWSVALNVIASVVWSLLGAPGQVELQHLFQAFRAFFGM